MRLAPLKSTTGGNDGGPLPVGREREVAMNLYPHIEDRARRPTTRNIRDSRAPWDPPPRSHELTDRRRNAIARRRRAAFEDGDDLDRGID
jgi:hypothetical protein